MSFCMTGGDSSLNSIRMVRTGVSLTAPGRSVTLPRASRMRLLILKPPAARRLFRAAVVTQDRTLDAAPTPPADALRRRPTPAAESATTPPREQPDTPSATRAPH